MLVKMAKEKSKILKYVLIVVTILIILEIGLFFANKDLTSLNQENQKDNEKENFARFENSTLIRMNLPAVDSEGKGVSTILNVEASPGSGKTLTDIENLLFWADTQQSIRMAKIVASNYSNFKPDSFNLIYTIEANASLIGGPSAGAALAIATIFALNGEKPREDIMITGTINHDGSIGPVSEILAKAKASKSAGATIFLVPLLQSRDVVYETEQNCETFGVSEICTTETKPRKINITEETGIEVVEVESVQDAMKYFFED